MASCLRKCFDGGGEHHRMVHFLVPVSLTDLFGFIQALIELVYGSWRNAILGNKHKSCSNVES